MDAFDIKLLDALQDDGRLTNQELADRVGLSASQCSRRRGALEESGIIEGYNARLSREQLGLGLVVFVEISLAIHTPANAAKLVDLLDGMGEVQEAYSLTGASDYLVKLVVPNLKRLSEILNATFLPHEGVAKVHSSIVLDRLKQTSKLPLGHLRNHSAGSVLPR